MHWTLYTSLSTMENKTKGRLLLRALDKGRSLQTLGKILRVMEIRRISTGHIVFNSKKGIISGVNVLRLKVVVVNKMTAK